MLASLISDIVKVLVKITVGEMAATPLVATLSPRDKGIGVRFQFQVGFEHYSRCWGL